MPESHRIQGLTLTLTHTAYYGPIPDEPGVDPEAAVDAISGHGGSHTVSKPSPDPSHRGPVLGERRSPPQSLRRLNGDGVFLLGP